MGDTCECGHVRDEHEESRGKCTIDGCGCIHFEEDYDTAPTMEDPVTTSANTPDLTPVDDSGTCDVPFADACNVTDTPAPVSGGGGESGGGGADGTF